MIKSHQNWTPKSIKELDVEKKKKISKVKVLKESELIRVKLKGFDKTEFNDMFFLYDEQSQATMTFDESIFNLDQLRVIFVNKIQVYDSSKELEIQIQTVDKNPEFLFDLWEILPPFSSPQEWIQLDQDKKELFQNCLEKLIGKENDFDLIIQPSGSAEDKKYRLIDTMFWFVKFD